MKERPLLFSGAMVRALLAGTKTQTRRAVKWKCPTPGLNLGFSGLRSHVYPQGWVLESSSRTSYEWRSQPTPCPHGQPGDHLWVRETWRGVVAISAPGSPAEYGVARYVPAYANCRRVEYAATHQRDGEPWRPSIHMPRWASRLTLDLVSVRVERLQDISEADALAEGIVRQPDGGYGLADTTHYHATDPRICYWSLWDHINGAGSVESNPFVWVLGFPSTTNPAQP